MSITSTPDEFDTVCETRHFRCPTIGGAATNITSIGVAETARSQASPSMRSHIRNRSSRRSAPRRDARRRRRERLFAFDQLDLVAVRIFDERDHRAAELHRAGFARDLDPLALEFAAGLVDVVHADRQMAERVALVVARGVPVV